VSNDFGSASHSAWDLMVIAFIRVPPLQFPPTLPPQAASRRASVPR
jgi:hypothetical protein